MWNTKATAAAASAQSPTSSHKKKKKKQHPPEKKTALRDRNHLISEKEAGPWRHIQEGGEKLCKKKNNTNFNYTPSYNLKNNHNPSDQHKSWHLNPHTQNIPHPNICILKPHHP